MTILNNVISAELELRRRARTGENLHAPEYWQEWCRTLFPNAFSKPFAQRHVDMWEWISSIQPGIKPNAFIGAWGRGGAKSTNGETGTIYIGAKQKRKFALYVSSTQLKADSHVASISAKLEDKTFKQYYAKMSRRAMNQYGSSKGWRRDILHCANGFTMQSFGLDTGMRGIKVEDYRPDLIILDDVDESNESLVVTLKKEKVITDAILPSGSSDCAIVFIQNLIHSDSIMSRLLDNRSDFLKNRQVSGPFPAIDNLSYEQRIGDDGIPRFYITGGLATWEGQDIQTCQSQIHDWGLSSFLRESQHEVDKTGTRWSHIDFGLIRKSYDEVINKLVRTVVWVDPAVTSTDQSDCQGINCGGTLPDGSMVFLYFWEGIDTPLQALKRAIYMGLEYHAEHVGVETDNGGDTWGSVYELAKQEVVKEIMERWVRDNPGIHISEMPATVIPKFTFDKAGHGHGNKVERNDKMRADYEKGRVFHMLGTHHAGEKALNRFDNPPLDLADSMFYTWWDLIGKKKARLHVAST